MSISNVHCVEWLDQISKNIDILRKKPRLNKADKIAFLNEQYFLLHLISRGIQGKVTFQGVPVIKDKLNK